MNTFILAMAVKMTLIDYFSQCCTKANASDSGAYYDEHF
jgi:hypothetical protein